MEKPDKDNRSFSKKMRWGCIIIPAILFVICLVLMIVFFIKDTKNEKPPYILDAEKKITEQEKDVEDKSPKYDIDKTMSAIYSIEKALAESKNFDQLTEFIVGDDCELVAPDVIKLKYKLFDSYKDILDSKDRIDELESLYSVAMRGISDIIGITGADPATGFTLDRNQIKKVWDKRLSEAKIKEKHKERLRNSQDKFIGLLFEYAKLSSKYGKEWDALCSMRDRAYLAFYERDYEELIASAAAAIQAAPTESEAHILLAMALIERWKETDKASAKALIEEILKNSQGQAASAYLLRGVIEMKEGNYDKAALDFDQAAAYYPKQQQELSNKLNLYKKRAFLHKSREGRVIINAYKGIMSGAGYFSPDFQKARMHIAKNEIQKAQEKTFDHFIRRRQQGQWDKVFADFQFCKNFLGAGENSIIREENIDISIEPSWLLNSIVVSVNNKSDKDIHNVSLLMCVRFTDMFRGDYLAFPFGATVAVIPAGQSASFGRENISDLTKENLGTVKKWKDMIECGAILISDETITWTEPIKNPGMTTENNTTPENSKSAYDTAKDAYYGIVNKIIESFPRGNEK